MEIKSRRLGRIEIEPGDLVDFPEGLVGMEQGRRFAFHRPAEAAPLAWMVSLDDPDLAFAVACVEQFAGEPYLPPLGEGDRTLLGVGPDDRVEVYVLVSPPDRSGIATVNLKGPLAVNPRTGRGRQLTLYSARFSTRQPIGPIGAEKVDGELAKRAA